MKVVILAGGFGTRISEDSHLKPKPMIEIGDQPILWHIMKELSYYGINEFIICAGYKQHVIKEYFFNYSLHRSDITFDLVDNNNMIIHNNVSEPWKVTVVDTGLNTMTGGRIKQIKDYVHGETFLMTYGDGVSDINISELVNFHKSHGKIATISTYNLGQKYGVIEMDENGIVKSFREKSNADGAMINIGFMALQPEIFDYIDGNDTIFEKEPLERVAKIGQLIAKKHNGFWQCMDTKRDCEKLNSLWSKNIAPWKVW